MELLICHHRCRRLVHGVNLCVVNQINSALRCRTLTAILGIHTTLFVALVAIWQEMRLRWTSSLCADNWAVMSDLLIMIQALRTERSLSLSLSYGLYVWINIWCLRTRIFMQETHLLIRWTVQPILIWSLHGYQILVQDIADLKSLYFKIGICLATFVVSLDLFSDINVQAGLAIQDSVIYQSVRFT